MLDNSTQTLATAKEILLKRVDLTDTKKHDLVSAITRIGTAFGTPLHDIPAEATTLRSKLADLHHKRMGISPKSLGNLKSNFKTALQVAGVLPADDPKIDLCTAWQAYSDGCEQMHQRYSLARFMRFCSVRGIVPNQVQDVTLDAFKDFLDLRSVGKDPEKLCKEIAQTWNGLNTRLGLGFAKLSYKTADRFVTLPLTDYPKSLQKEIEAYLQRQQVVDLFDESAPDKPLKEVSIRNVSKHLARFLHALRDSGVNVGEMADLKTVVTADNMKAAFRQIMKDMRVQAGGKIPPTLHNIGATLKAVAKHHLGMPAADLAEIDQIRKKVAHKPKGMSEKNRERLAVFDDWRNVLNLLGLPKELMARAQGQKHTRTAALDAMYAAVITVFLSAPMRIKNVASLRIGQHIVPMKKGKTLIYSIRVPDVEVKNGQHVEVNLSQAHSELLRVYIEEYRSLLTGHQTDALFPRENDGQPRSPSNLGQALSEKIKREIGLKFNAHLFRHFAAYLFLSQRPGELETVRRMLGHKNIQTTLNFYAEITSKEAHARYQAAVLDKFEGAKK